MNFIKLQKIEEFEDNNYESNLRSLKKQTNKQSHNTSLNNTVICHKKFAKEKQKSLIEDTSKILLDGKNTQNFILLKNSNELCTNKNLKKNEDTKNLVIINNVKCHEIFLNFKGKIISQHLKRDKNKSEKNFVHPFDDLNYGKYNNTTYESRNKKGINYYYSLIKVKNKFNNLLNEKHNDKLNINFCNSNLNKTLCDSFKKYFIHKKSYSNENYESFYNLNNNILLDSISKGIKHSKFNYLNTLYHNSLNDSISKKILNRINLQKKNNDFNIGQFKFGTNNGGEHYRNSCKKIKKLDCSNFDFHKNIRKNKSILKDTNYFFNNIFTLYEKNVNQIKRDILCLRRNFDFDSSLNFLNNYKVNKNNEIFKIKRTEEKGKISKNGASMNLKGKQVNEPLIGVEKKIDQNLENTKTENKIKRETTIKKSEGNSKSVNQKIYKKKKKIFKRENNIKREEKYYMFNSKNINMIQKKKVDIINENVTEKEIYKQSLSKVKIYNSIKERGFVGEKKIMRLHKMKNNLLNENLEIKEKRRNNILNSYLEGFCYRNKGKIKKEKSIKNIMNKLGKHNKESLFEFNKRIKFNFIYADNLNENSLDETNFTSQKNTNNYTVYNTKSMNNNIFGEDYKKKEFYFNIEDSTKNKKRELLKMNLRKMECSSNEKKNDDTYTRDNLTVKKIQNKFNEKENGSSSKKIKIHKCLYNFKKLIKEVKKYIYINITMKMKKGKYLLKDIHFLKKYLYKFSKLKKKINKKNSKIKPLNNLHIKNNSILNKSYINKNSIKKCQSNLKTNDKGCTMNKIKKIEKEKSSLKNLNDAECKIYTLLEKISNEHKKVRMK
ncbi:hypothetical protein PRELSG_1268900 [Plasmodium relictum]|uniref:Uncharacterized protein n=1 Tax=Plasmodium relictum TaxID=85471 RepID=A0A1J1HBC9_PLARL|nr:hypothetical protein PRELSG_1268900 [Plasmodium relictum]CRH01793.1 hypothetical protein PRELSG_1268900 [Plasmodium relictum]